MVLSTPRSRGLGVRGRHQRRTGGSEAGTRKGKALRKLRSKWLWRAGRDAGGQAPLGAGVRTLTPALCPLPPQSRPLSSSETLLPLPVGLGELHHRWPGSASAELRLGPWPPGPALAPGGPSPQVPAQVHGRPPGGPRLLLEDRRAEPGEETAAQVQQLHLHPSGQGDEPGAGAARGGRPAVAQEVLKVRVGARGV